MYTDKPVSIQTNSENISLIPCVKIARQLVLWNGTPAPACVSMKSHGVDYLMSDVFWKDKTFRLSLFLLQEGVATIMACFKNNHR